MKGETMAVNNIANDIARLAKQLQQASNEFSRGETLLASTLAQDVAWELERLFRAGLIPVRKVG
jgi:hypothetical protein